MKANMRNRDKIKVLEKELGKYRKKVFDQSRELERYKRRCDIHDEAILQLNASLDAILIQCALKYGREEREEGKVLGHRLELPMIRVDDLHRRYEIRSRKDEETDNYIIGVVPREET